MNDLEFAAKAAGIEGNFIDGKIGRFVEGVFDGDYVWWNPLTSGDDSQKLQAKLRIDIDWATSSNYVSAITYANDRYKNFESVEFNPTIEGDDLRAVREAVFAVAVQIGKGMDK